MQYLGMESSALWKLQLVQNTAVHLLSNTGYREHIKPDLHWLLIEFRIKLKVSELTVKGICSVGSGYLRDSFKFQDEDSSR